MGVIMFKSISNTANPTTRVDVGPISSQLHKRRIDIGLVSARVVTGYLDIPGLNI